MSLELSCDSMRSIWLVKEEYGSVEGVDTDSNITNLHNRPMIAVFRRQLCGENDVNPFGTPVIGGVSRILVLGVQKSGQKYAA